MPCPLHHVNDLVEDNTLQQIRTNQYLPNVLRIQTSIDFCYLGNNCPSEASSGFNQFLFLLQMIQVNKEKANVQVCIMFSNFKMGTVSDSTSTIVQNSK